MQVHAYYNDKVYIKDYCDQQSWIPFEASKYTDDIAPPLHIIMLFIYHIY